MFCALKKLTAFRRRRSHVEWNLCNHISECTEFLGFIFFSILKFRDDITGIPVLLFEFVQKSVRFSCVISYQTYRLFPQTSVRCTGEIPTRSLTILLLIYNTFRVTAMFFGTHPSLCWGGYSLSGSTSS